MKNSASGRDAQNSTLRKGPIGVGFGAEVPVLMASDYTERCCSVTRRHGCPNWNQGAIGAFTAAVWFGGFMSEYLSRERPTAHSVQNQE